MDVYKIRKKTGLVVQVDQSDEVKFAVFVGRPVEDALDRDYPAPPGIGDEGQDTRRRWSLDRRRISSRSNRRPRLRDRWGRGTPRGEVVMAHIGTVMILGQELEVHATMLRRKSDAYFSIKDGDDTFGKGESLDQAKQTARTYLNKRRVEVEVPFALSDGRRGVAIKRDGRDRSIVCDLDGQRDALTPNQQVFKPDTPQDVLAEFHAIERETIENQKRAREIEREWSFRIGASLDRAIEEKTAQL